MPSINTTAEYSDAAAVSDMITYGQCTWVYLLHLLMTKITLKNHIIIILLYFMNMRRKTR